MLPAVAQRRRELFAAARSEREDFVRLDPSRLRFSLGTTPGDPRVPVQVTAEASALVHSAAADLALFLSTAHRHFVAADDLDRLVMSEGYALLPMPAPTLGPSGGGLDLRAAAQGGLSAHPALTGGLLCAWMGPGGRGRSLTGLWIEAMKSGLAEMRGDPEEETPLIAALALHGEMLAGAEAARERLAGPPVDRYLRAALGLGLWVAARTGVARAWRDAGRPASDPLLLRLEAVLAPGPLCGRAKLGGATLYGCELTAGMPRAEEEVARLAGGAAPEAVAEAVAEAVGGEPAAAQRAGLAVAVARMRDLLSAALLAAEAGGHGNALSALRERLTAPGALSEALAEEPGRRALKAECAPGEALPGEASQILAEVGRVLKRWRGRDPGSAFGLQLPAACREYAECVTSAYCDAALERWLQPARRALLRRTGQETEAGADAEWEGGRLYRISTRGGPILKQARAEQHGQLFADVKDFTRRTGLLGQAAMAEVLRTEFYGPILAAAKRYYGGMSHLSDRGGVSLNNLLGDAISFTGDVESLVALAIEIRRSLADYGTRLQRLVSSQGAARQLADVESRHREGLARQRRDLALARAALEKAPPGSGAQVEALAQVARLGREEDRLGREREQMLARARGEGLEAGVFIAFGAPPQVVLIDDEVFGQNRVAIGDKINESARGTTRSPLGRARADAELEAERTARGSPRLQHAWSVFVDHPLTVNLPAHVEREALAAARAGDTAGALQAVSGPVREALAEASRGLGPEEPGELYNAGAALSQAALDAFREATRKARLWREVVLDPASAPEELQARWFYGAAPQPLVATFDPEGRPAELFRRVGRAAMKGLGDVPVWEIATGPGPEALVRALGLDWLKLS